MGILDRMLRRIFSILRFGWLTLRIAGPRVFFKQLRYQLYRRIIFVVRIEDSSEERTLEQAANCYSRMATPDEVEEFFQKMYEEKSPESRYELLARKWFYENGFHRVIIVWTADTNEMCNIRWLITAEDIRDAGFEGRLPELQKDYVLSENAYTLERFRGRGIQTTSGLQLVEIIRSLGYKKIVSQIAEDNIPSLKSSRKRGGMMSERVLERHFLFGIKRTTLERFDPPVHYRIPGENGKSDTTH